MAIQVLKFVVLLVLNYKKGFKMIDRRPSFDTELWQQGRLLITPQTRRWNQEEKDRTDEQEHKMLFARFLSSDSGRGRVLLWVFDTVEECEKAVTEHNKRFQNEL